MVGNLTIKDFDSNGNINISSMVIVMVRTDGCPYCVQAKPAYDEFAKQVKDVKPYYILLDGGEIGKAFREKLPKILGGEFKGVPTFAVFNNGKFVKKYEGKRDADSFLKFIEEVKKECKNNDIGTKGLSFGRSQSPTRRRSSPTRRRSKSPTRRRSSPTRRRSSPTRRRSKSPTRRRSSPTRRRSSPTRRRSSPTRRRSKSPTRRRSQSPSKILNKKSGRYVLKSGTIGQAIMKKRR
jgi:thiol-disulfide isomerase/thioredoxin